ncbi:S-type pyocin domain-containing protein [Pseudomonas hefeiensis]|uniref:S-type pyocin domain-containing protein n=1 Tax=Pseudomonas hefeiensis TaxID=2738125 RepID=A0ABY9GIZ5_9PSED|nr:MULTISPECIES: S-type pyocin domain-containing protein [unclassified Pseudomonas]WLH15148.1 S-type pyocin domain-containing protein [Pseudomonas sp. FP205]WLH98194.1 S-type pyocin domain-containing protein [Pseudomonas sp. FP53]WLI42470.1 S-type pyocin domain-containing protein [Pseudomonas sp. FP821]
MATRTFSDGSDGTVVIRPGPTASGGGFQIGSGGFSGGFGGSGSRRSKRRRKARARARYEQIKAQQEAQAKADAEKATAMAQEQARLQARQQALATMVQRYTNTRAEVDRNFAGKKQQLDASLQKDIAAAKRPPVSNSTERWQLYTITKEKNEIDGLIARKTTELNAKNSAARVFDGQDPLTRSANDYRTRLAQFGAALEEGHRLWEQAYTAAQEARLLSEQIKALTEKSNSLARHHAEQTVVWREREAVWERQRQYAEQRAERIRFKQQVDESIRLERFRQIHTLSVPALSMTAGGMVLSQGTVFVPRQDTAVLDKAVQSTVEMLGELKSIALKGPGLFIALATHTTPLGNGELTVEQRRRLFQGVGVPAQALGLADEQRLRSVADAGGSVEMPHRLKPETVSEGTTIHVASTGGAISAQVPVINAVLDPLSGLYKAEVPGVVTRQLQFATDAVPHTAPTTPSVLMLMAPQVETLPAGADLRIQDCIVCVPGLPPTYFSFDLPPLGSGIVTGAGKPAANDWWNTASQAQGAAIPEQLGHQLRAREIKSFSAFDQAVWQTLAEHPTLWSDIDEINQKRIERGFAPYAPKSTWVGERRQFELRYQERAELGENPFNLDRISITTPNSLLGRPGIVPAVIPWPAPPIGNGPRTPLVPPGIEQLGPTTLPITPPLSPVYPGNPVIPVLPENETFPAVDPGQVGANIPGYPADMELPSPGLVFVGPPVEPLEVGPYNELSGRSRADGLDIDHIPSRKALEFHIRMNGYDMSPFEIREAIRRAPCIAVPSSVHREFSETYGGRNSLEKSMNDAADLEAAVNSNLAALKPGLMESGASESDIDAALELLHDLHKKQGWY